MAVAPRILAESVLVYSTIILPLVADTHQTRFASSSITQLRHHTSSSSIVVIVLNDILLDEQILTQPFSCDVKKCKGACCTMEGGAGAPLRNDEIDSIQASVDAALPYLAERSKQIIREQGWLIADRDGLATRCIDDRDCVFVFYDEEIAKCALERAYFNGESSFRKPLSCHLFPVRVADFGGDYLYYERIEECSPAITHGTTTNETIVTTVQSALERAYGSEWTHAAVELAHQIRQDGTH